jgi:hypothetical protein
MGDSVGVASPRRITAGSVGIGLRFNYGKNIIAKLDLGRVTHSPGNAADINNTNSVVGDKRGSLSLVGSW